MRFQFSLILFLITGSLFSQEKIDTISYCRGCNYAVRTFDLNNILRISCEYKPDSITLERESIFDDEGKLEREIYFGEGSDRYISEWNSITTRIENSNFNSWGELTDWSEIPTDSTDAYSISYYSSGIKMYEGTLALVDVFTAKYEDSVSLAGLQLQKIKNQTKVGQWKFYYLNGQLEEEGNYARFCVMSWDTVHVVSDGVMEELYVVMQSDGIKTGEWNYYSDDGKLIYIEDWSNGNLLGRKTF